MRCTNCGKCGSDLHQSIQLRPLSRAICATNGLTCSIARSLLLAGYVTGGKTRRDSTLHAGCAPSEQHAHGACTGLSQRDSKADTDDKISAMRSQDDKKPEIFASEEECSPRVYAPSAFGRVNALVRNRVVGRKAKRSIMRAGRRNHLKRVDLFNASKPRRDAFIDDE